MIRTPVKQSSNDYKIIIEQRKGTYGSLGFRSASIATSEGRSYVAYSGESHLERDRTKLINQSRYFMRNNAIYKGMIEQMVRYIVGNGFELQLTGASKSAIAKTEKLWRDFNKKPEIRNLLSGGKVAQMILREVIVAGDTVILKTDKGLIQHFEAEQLDGPNNFPNGIKKDKYGRPMFFHLCPWKKFAVDNNNGRSYPASEVLFVTNPERPSQIRGVPAAQAAFPMLHRINDVCDSEAIAWQLLSRLAISITREQGPELAYTESKEDETKTAESLEGDLATRLVELDYALIHHANPGEKVEGIERNIPGMNFSESLKMFLRLLGLPLGLPLELILLDWTNSNYSQSRAVLEQTFENFKDLQQLLIDLYYQPLFEWKLQAWKASGEIASSINFQVNWITKTFPWIDQLKEAQAYATQVERGFITHNRVCKSLNLDQAEVVEQRSKEIEAAINISKKIETSTGVKVPWEYFAGIKPGQDKSTLAKTEEGQAGNKENKEDTGD